jgi:hypothetical protein
MCVLFLVGAAIFVVRFAKASERRVWMTAILAMLALATFVAALACPTVLRHLVVPGGIVREHAVKRCEYDCGVHFDSAEWGACRSDCGKLP